MNRFRKEINRLLGKRKGINMLLCKRMSNSYPEDTIEAFSKL